MIAATVGLAVALSLLAPAARAGQPHFVGQFTAVRNADGSLTISGKEAGLGSEDQVHIVVDATAECINGGGNHPKAVNKEGVTGAGDFPVQNGKAYYSVTLYPPAFQPPCDPPMTIGYADVTVSDDTNGISQGGKGPF
jgi:hypothetical protein